MAIVARDTGDMMRAMPHVEENSMVMVRQVKHEEFVYTQNSRGEAVLAAKKADTENIIKTMKLDGKNTEKAITTMASSGDSSYGCCIY